MAASRSLHWRFVSIQDFKPSTQKVAETARIGLAALGRKFRSERPQPHLKPMEVLKSLTEDQLAGIAPEPDWREASRVLDQTLKDWLAQKSEQPILALVLPPYNGHPHILTAWARLRNLPILYPPEPDQILTGGRSWLAGWKESARLWTLPALERLYLRHVDGLGLVRRFFELALSGDLGRGVIGCDSWAWEFISHVWRGPLPPALTLQAFEGPNLAGYFQHLGQKPARPTLFRKADSGDRLLPLPQTEGEEVEVNDFFYQLAASSRGNLGIAWLYWRASLRSGPEEENISHPPPTIWVAAWDQLQQPALPAGAGWEEGWVLHALLLHHGLPLAWLSRILPLDPHRLAGILQLLESQELVERHQNEWRVSAPGYPAVRKFLKSSGYLTDRF